MIIGQNWKCLAVVAMACATGLSAGAALSHGLDGKSHSPRPEPCYWLTGTLSLSGDNGFVIGRDRGGSVIVGHAPNDAGWPGDLQRNLEKAQADTGYVDAWVHGTFKVCPISSESPSHPWLHFVYIRSAVRLTREQAGDRK